MLSCIQIFYSRDKRFHFFDQSIEETTIPETEYKLYYKIKLILTIIPVTSILLSSSPPPFKGLKYLTYLNFIKLGIRHISCFACPSHLNHLSVPRLRAVGPVWWGESSFPQRGLSHKALVIT